MSKRTYPSPRRPFHAIDRVRVSVDRYDAEMVRVTQAEHSSELWTSLIIHRSFFADGRRGHTHEHDVD